MDSASENDRDHVQRMFPTLDRLIGRIDRKFEQAGLTDSGDGFAAFRGRRANENKKHGRQHIRFMLGDTAFAIPLSNAMEIDHVPEIRPLPNLPPWVLGICHLRGSVVSVIDLKKILKATAGGNASKRMILIRHAEVTTALLVDKVLGILSIEDEGVERDRRTGEGFQPYTRAMIESDGQPVYLLDLNALMTFIAVV